MIVDSAILNELPFSIEEVQSIKTLFNNAGLVAKSLVKQEATKNNFLKYENYFDIIHIATHGYSYDNKPELSYLAFAPEEKKADFKNFFIGNKLNKEQTWIMRSGAMYNLNLHADLLVLSACETGFGAMKRGEGIMAMTRGFIYSGASNIVYTLWGVEDKTTSQLMYDFYKNILFGDKYPNALRKAKINLINSPNTAFPRSWAGYFLLGE
jgi:CHAT domain-containing protein